MTDFPLPPRIVDRTVHDGQADSHKATPEASSHPMITLVELAQWSRGDLVV